MRLDIRLASSLETLVELLEAVVIAGSHAHVNPLSREVVERIELGRFRTGDDRFVDRPTN
jgi:hypothetical protein